LEGGAEEGIIQCQFPGALFAPDNVLLASAHWRAGEPALQIDEVTSCRRMKIVPGVIPLLWRADGNFLLSLGNSVTGESYDHLEVSAWLLDRQSHSYKGKAIRLPFAQVWEVAVPAPAYRLRGEIERLIFRADGQQLIASSTLWDVRMDRHRPLLRQTGVQVPGGVIAFRGAQVRAARPPNRRWLDSQKERDELLATRFLAAVIDSASGCGQGAGVLVALGSLAGTQFAVEWFPATISQLVPPAPGATARLDPPPQEYTHDSRSWDTARPAVTYLRFFIARPAVWQPEGRLLFCRMDHGTAFIPFPPSGSGMSESIGLQLLCCWDTETAKPVSFTRKYSKFNLADVGLIGVPFFQPDGRRLATCWGAEVVLWDSSTCSVLKSFSTGLVSCERAAWSQDGKFLLAHSDQGNKAFVFSVDGDEQYILYAPRNEWRSFTLSTKGSQVVTGGEDKLIRIRDVKTGKELARWQGHETAITALTFSPDGKLLVSGARDGTIRVWNLPWIREELAKLGLDW
jgi:hypothetical protein